MAQEPGDGGFEQERKDSTAGRLERNPTPNREPLEW